MLGVSSRPKLEGLALKLTDQLCRLRPFPETLVAVLPGAADPPTLPGQAVRLTHDEDRELRLPSRLGLVIDKSQDLAQGAHLGPREMMTEQTQHFGIADGLSGACRRNEDRPHL